MLREVLLVAESTPVAVNVAVADPDAVAVLPVALAVLSEDDDWLIAVKVPVWVVVAEPLARTTPSMVPVFTPSSVAVCAPLLDWPAPPLVFSIEKFRLLSDVPPTAMSFTTRLPVALAETNASVTVEPEPLWPRAIAVAVDEPLEVAEPLLALPLLSFVVAVSEAVAEPLAVAVCVAVTVPMPRPTAEPLTVAEPLLEL